MPAKRPYFPQRTFDDDLDAFAQLCQAQGWTFSGVDTKQLLEDATAQRTERTDHDAAELAFNHTHESFGLAQSARYDRFAAALQAARGAFRSNRAVLAQLDRFRRSTHRTTTTNPKEPITPA
jgi:hypothetical protein